jgi:site-specific recombinase XerD
LKILKAFTSDNDVLFSDINFAFVDSFNNFLKAKGYQQNTIHKHHKNIKKFIGLAIKKEITDTKNPYEKYKVKSEQKPHNVLRMQEVQALANLTFNESENKLSQVRDMFLFACYTGLRISDVRAMQNKYIKTTDDGLELDFFTIKVNKRAELPLYKLFNGLPEIILRNYMKDSETLVFTNISEQYINRHLKVLAQRTGIKFNLTFHIGRETFGTYMATKVQPFELMRLMQHSDIKTTMRYVHLSKQMIHESLDKVTSWT